MRNVGVKVCPKLSEETAIIIGEAVPKSDDVRDFISISKLIRRNDRPEKIEIMDTFNKYGEK